jgi:hypothetical protein
MLVLLIEKISEYEIEMASCDMIYMLSFMKFDRGVQAILRFCLRNLRVCNVGITDGWYL